MKHFRRSTKAGDRLEPRHGHISIPHKDAIAINPPKKVIKALYDYTNPDNDPMYMSFSQGDFLHVVGRENDADWYEASNPIVGTRGLVPVNYFELVSKQVRSGSGLEPIPVAASRQDARIQSMQGHDSGYAEKTNGRASANQQAQPGLPRMSATLARNSGAMVYGVVQYDFKAERPDELEAKAGEAIIVIAQSNPEWFVAKPITRLGGPGLIPVSFISIRDMTTGQQVENTQDAVTRAGVPKVEEWKRMAASYKNSSIPLGKLDSQSAQNSERASVSSARRSADSYGQDGRYSHHRTNSAQQDFSPQQQSYNSRMYPPLRARVPRFCHHEGKFWFIVEAFMEDGKYWELNREYTDFYTLQTSLMEQFPEAAGHVDGVPRTLPLMPGPLPWVTEHLTKERRAHMDKYIRDLLMLDANIVGSHIVRGFFAPRDGDVETEPPSDEDADWIRNSAASSQTSYPHDSRQSSTGNLSAATGHTSPSKSAHAYQHQSPPMQNKQPPGHYRAPSDMRIPNGSGMPPLSMYKNTAGNGSFSSGNAQSGPSNAAVKIKVFLNDQSTVVVRLPATFTYPDLLQKLRDRWALESDVDPSSVSETEFVIEYRDEATSAFYRLSNEQDLRVARERNEKLALRVAANQVL